MIPEEERYTPEKGEGIIALSPLELAEACRLWFGIQPDEEKLAAFEALVQTQKPAETPWTPVTDFSFEARKAIEGIHPQLIKDVFQPKYVIDAGCGSGVLVDLLRNIGLLAVGFDKSYDAAPNDLTSPECGSTWQEWGADLVVCREVLEHLTITEIRIAVSNLCRMAHKFVYVTTRFANAPQHLLDVDTSDDLDPTHITLLNQNLLRLLFVLEGFTRRADLETRIDWQNKGRCLVYERG